MKRFLILFFVVVIGGIVISASLPVSNEKARNAEYPLSTVKQHDGKSPGIVSKSPDFGKIPLYFIPNKGQVDEEARFYAKTSQYTLWLTKKGLIFDSIKRTGIDTGAEEEPGRTYERDVTRLTFLDSNSVQDMVPVEITSHVVNYFKGQDPSKWQKGIPTSKAVLYKEVYQNIDLKIYGIEKEIEYDWIVKPGGNPGDIVFEYQSVKSCRLDIDGSLVIESKFGELTHRKPVGYQLIDDKRVDVISSFRKTGEFTYGFNVEKYDTTQPLIIDPMVAMTYSTYLGGNGDDEGFGMEVDDTGIYVIGYTDGTGFPSTIIDGPRGNDDIFVAKFNPEGSERLYSTIIAGSSLERGVDIALDANGYVYGAAYTYSSDIPASNSRSGKRDAYFFVLNANGGRINSTYIGGAENDSAGGIALSSTNTAIITGYTNSTNFPTQDAYQPQLGNGTGNNYDAFIVKINTSTNVITYSTYFGGSGKDVAYGIALDSSNNIYFSGFTTSTDLPLMNPYQPIFGGVTDAYVCKLKADGSALLGCTYLGGSNVDEGAYLAVDSSGNVYITGKTKSDDFPVIKAIQAYRAGEEEDDTFDAFLTKLNANCSNLVFSTYLGGELDDGGWRVTLGPSNAPYVNGFTYSNDFPVKNAFQEEIGGDRDAWAAEIDATGTHIVFCTYLGGSGEECHFEYIGDIALDGSGNIYVTGSTNSTDFPTHNPYDNAYTALKDVFITRYTFLDCDPILWTDKTLLNFGVKENDDITEPQTFIIRNIGGGTLAWTVTDNASWLTCSPASGKNFGVVEVSFTGDPDDLEYGPNKAEITISASNAEESPQKVYVTVWRHASGYPIGGTVPFGAFELPASGSNIGTSTVFSGWALDDIEVVGVKLYYEDDSNLVYVGDATFVEDARPDVWQVYPDYPHSSRAGWGYVLIPALFTNGTHTFHAIATDKEGNQVTLGTRTCNIVSSVYPFGNIDIPEPGGTASGSNFSIEGWALASTPRCIDSVEVFIDGVSKGLAEYGESCAGFIPSGYCDSSAACFSLKLNTIGYKNGVHTIYCTLDDGSYETEIGHRYFNIRNIGTINSASQSTDTKLTSILDITKIPFNYAAPVEVNNGYRDDANPRVIEPDKNGHIYVQIKELERVKIRLNTSEQMPGSRQYTGYHIFGDQLKPLPIGSTLDRENGIFYWQAGAGFIGNYRLVFIETGPNREMNKRFIDVKISPKINN